MPEYTVVGEGFASAEEAMKSIGIDDCDKYLYEKTVYKADIYEEDLQ